jgi:peptidoglycan/xylan/chitin deacetylase (PgdA/CDA1 family)
MLRYLYDGAIRKVARYYRSKPFAMRNTAPIVSFTFDDVPESAYTNGATILESQGIRGTFYIASGTLGTNDIYWRVIGRDQVRALYRSGHEIGCHTYSHVAVDKLDAAEVEDECQRNRDVLRELCPGVELTNFCYPFGRVSLRHRRQLEDRFETCRSIYQGINAGTLDLGLLRVIELYDRTLTPAKLERVLRQNSARNGWLIFYTHDVADVPSWIGCSLALLQATARAARAAGMQCLPVRGALTAIGYSAATAEMPAFNACETSASR